MIAPLYVETDGYYFGPPGVDPIYLVRISRVYHEDLLRADMQFAGGIGIGMADVRQRLFDGLL